jgi:hypothetical protein
MMIIIDFIIVAFSWVDIINRKKPIQTDQALSFLSQRYIRQTNEESRYLFVASSFRLLSYSLSLSLFFFILFK